MVLFYGLIIGILSCGLCIEIGKHETSNDEDDVGMHDFSATLNFGGPLPTKVNSLEKDNKYWLDNALKSLKARTEIKQNTKKAKNIILFLGDGMGISTLTAARIYNGQLHNENGEETFLTFEKFPYTGLSKTYCVDAQVADSACTSTAYTSGVKASIGTMGVNAQVGHGDCKTSKNNNTRTQSIVEWAMAAGMSTGVVTTTTITHASPGGNYAHTASRDWECDTDRPKGVDCQDIASQLIKNFPGNKINVLMGGGYRKFALQSQKGKRLDEDLLQAYRDNRAKNRDIYKLVRTKKELDTVNATHDYVLGLFGDGHLTYQLDKPGHGAEEPSLSEMTAKAIEVLSKNKNGFYLFVEGGRIDMAHHASKARKALAETIEFDNAIAKARLMTNPDETLIVVTADHSHTFTISGYPDRGNPIFGKAKFGGDDIKASDNLPYLTLGYNNGPGYQMPDRRGIRQDVSNDKTSDKDFAYPSGIPLEYETHGGEDVAVFSTGPWSHLLVGNFEQNYIPIVMAYAARIGPAKEVPMASSAPSVFSSYHVMFVTLGALVFCKYSAKQ